MSGRARLTTISPNDRLNENDYIRKASNRAVRLGPAEPLAQLHN
jgi:hypothetical protein